MAQTYTDNCFIASGAGKTDLQNIENNFAAVKSSFSGSSAPSDLVNGMLWYDTSAGAADADFYAGLKIYGKNAAGSNTWLRVLQGDASLKMWVYRNDACEGWVIDASVTDRVLAVKGGSQAFNVSGGNTGGTWTISGVSIANHTHTMGEHCHLYFDYDYDTTQHVYNSSGLITGLSSIGSLNYTFKAGGLSTSDGVQQDLYTSKTLTAASDTGSASTTPSSDGTWRPSAAVGTLQYPDF